MLKVERAEFARLFREVASSYPFEPDGVRHLRAYKENRWQGRCNFQAILEAAGSIPLRDRRVAAAPPASYSGLQCYWTRRLCFLERRTCGVPYLLACSSKEASMPHNAGRSNLTAKRCRTLG